MEKVIPDEIRSKLEMKLQSAGKKAPVTKLRESNINWIKSLPRTGLAYQKKERQILIHTTGFGERIFLQYPGKESRTYNKDGKKRKKTAIRPWDFRPILYTSKTDKPHRDMSFGMMWATIFEMAKKIAGRDKNKIIRMFATLLYRMAFMLDHVEIKHFRAQERDVMYKRDGKFKLFRQRKKEYPALFKYKPDKQVLEYITKRCPRWGEMSLEAFLFYNELLVWNEDCKYYYRNFHVSDDAKWITSTGRINTLLSHIRILGYILGDVPLSNIFDDFARQKGISPAHNDEIIRICGKFIKTE